MKAYATEIADLGDISVLQLAPQPALSSFIGSRRWSKSRREVVKRESSHTLPELCTRLGSLAYLENELKTIVQRVYQDDAAEVIATLDQILRSSSQAVSEFLACKLINEDLYPKVFQGLYQQSDLSSRIDHMIAPFKLLLAKCPEQHFHTVLVRAMAYFVEAWNRGIVEAEGSDTLRDTFAADLVSVQHFFEARDKKGAILGIDKSEQAPLLTATAELMSLVLKPDDALVPIFKDPESAGQKRVWICYVFYYRQSRPGLEFIAEHRHLVL